MCFVLKGLKWDPQRLYTRGSITVAMHQVKWGQGVAEVKYNLEAVLLVNVFISSEKSRQVDK
jgi:hypothetical protein